MQPEHDDLRVERPCGPGRYGPLLAGHSENLAMPRAHGDWGSERMLWLEQCWCPVGRLEGLALLLMMGGSLMLVVACCLGGCWCSTVSTARFSWPTSTYHRFQYPHKDYSWNE